MARKHTVITGDTLFKIAVQYYGDGNKYPVIYRANPIIKDENLIYPGWVLTIPDLEQEEEQEEEIIDITDDINKVTIQIDGEDFEYFTSINIDDSFDKITEFSFKFPFDPDDEVIKEKFKPFSQNEVIIFVGNEKLTTGYITTLEPSSTENSSGLAVSGYAKCGIMFDSYMPSSSFPLSFDGLNLQEIAETLAEPFGIRVDFSESAGAVFEKDDKVVLDPFTTPGEFLIKLAHQRGFVITSDSDGKLLFHKSKDGKADFIIKGGEPPFLSSSGTSYDIRNRHSEVTAFGTNYTEGAGDVQTESDNSLKNNGITRVLNFDASDSNEGSLKNVATQRLARTQAAGFNLDISLLGWRYGEENKLYKSNTIIEYENKYDMIYNASNFLVRSVNYNKTDTAMTVSINLVFPNSFSDSIQEVFPWG
jgi:prophage tail gpP-like protein